MFGNPSQTDSSRAMSSSHHATANADRHQAAMRFLRERINYERLLTMPYGEQQLKLDRMRELLDRLGNPQESFPIIHVAGTKGKGSTASMIGAILAAQPLRVGLFTSPHMDRIEQRLAIDGRPCSPDELVDVVQRVAPSLRAMDDAARRDADADAIGPTFFETVTAMALTHFARREVDLAVLEVGLGGRLDSTNVCRTQVSVITSVSFDHTAQLGHTLEAIAGEKAGIIKPGIPVVSGVTTPEPRDVIRRVCEERGSSLMELGRDFDVEYHAAAPAESTSWTSRIDFRCHVAGKERSLDNVTLALTGRHQAANAAVALAALGELSDPRFSVCERAIREGLAGVVCPGRAELLCRRPSVVVDVAHNRASIEALIDVLEEGFSTGRKLLVFATSREKDISGMLELLVERFDEILFTRYVNNPRAVPPEELAETAAGMTGRSYRICATPQEAWRQASQLSGAEDTICVTGSFFIVAEMRPLIQARPDGGGRL